MQIHRREQVSRQPNGPHDSPVQRACNTLLPPAVPVQHITIPATSVGFDDLRRLGAVLWVIDAENLNYSLSRIGWKPDYGAMLQRIASVSESVDAHAFMSTSETSMEPKRRYFASQGIAPHLRTHDTILAVGQAGPHCNSDNELLLHLGFLCGQRTYDTVILGTGDGALGCAAGNFLAGLAQPPRVYTISVQGSTSVQLLTRSNWLINGNMIIGGDLVRRYGDASVLRTRH